MTEKQFFKLNELQELGLPAERTLRNNLDAGTGVIAIGGDAPPLRSMLLGGNRVVTKSQLDDWLRAVANHHASVPTTPGQPKRRRGRPRRAASIHDAAA